MDGKIQIKGSVVREIERERKERKGRTAQRRERVREIDGERGAKATK